MKHATTFKYVGLKILHSSDGTILLKRLVAETNQTSTSEYNLETIRFE